MFWQRRSASYYANMRSGVNFFTPELIIPVWPTSTNILFRVMFTKYEADLLCQNMPYIYTTKGRGVRVSLPLLIFHCTKNMGKNCHFQLTQSSWRQKHFTARRMEDSAPVPWVHAGPMQALTTEETTTNHPLPTASWALKLQGGGCCSLRRRAARCRRRWVVHWALDQSPVGLEDAHHLLTGNQL